ncbi:MAG: hypothetical protein ABSF89_17515 [Acidimicrobiales bacterium]
MSSLTKVATGWRARWRTPDGKSRSKTFAWKIDAEKHLTGTDHAKLTGAYVDPRAGRITFRSYGEQWRAVQVHRPSTAVQLETNLRRHVYPTLGDRPIGAIRPSEVQAWVRSLAEDLEPSTVELVYRYVVAIFRAAAADRVIPQNPAVGTRLPKAEPRRVEPLEAEVVQAIIAAVPDRYRALVVLAAGTQAPPGRVLRADVGPGGLPAPTAHRRPSTRAPARVRSSTRGSEDPGELSDSPPSHCRPRCPGRSPCPLPGRSRRLPVHQSRR